MKILHVLNTSTFSGAENVVCQIISMFNEDKNIEMAYCSPEGNIRDTLLEKGIKYIPVKKLYTKELKKVLNEYKPDIIHAHDMKASFISSLVSGKTPIISHIHNNAFDSRKLNIKSLAFLFATLKISHIYWVSNSAFEGYFFKKLVRNKSEILYNIINKDKTHEIAEKDCNIYEYDVVYLGRLTYPKNPERLINILKEIVGLKKSIKIAIIGSGELTEKVKNLIAEHKLTENINLLGYMKNPLKVLKNSKVMVLTSRWEGTPMCVLEAMALGVPIVSTPVDGVKELIKNGINGFLTDNDSEFAKNVVSIVNDLKLQKRMSEETVKIFDGYCDISKYKGVLRESYDSVI